MKRSGFSKPTIKEVREKQAKKRAEKELQPNGTWKRTSPKKTPFVRAQNALGRAKTPKPTPQRKPKDSQAKLKKKLDLIFSKYIRLKFADSNGFNKCYTCDVFKHYKEMQNGHYISRQYLATRFDENNCRPQCVGCNLYGSGKPLDFEENLKKELGSDFVEAMKLKRHLTTKLDSSWYKEKIAHYTAILALLHTL